MESTSSLRLAELERGSVMRNIDSIPRDSSKAFKVIDRAQVFLSSTIINRI